MPKKRNQIDTAQLSLFDHLTRLTEEKRAAAGSEGTMNVRDRLRRALNRAIKECSLSRHQIAGEMSHLLGVEITKAVIDAWTAESKDNYRIPAEYLPAFCRATGSNDPIEILNDTVGMFSMPGPDALRSEIQRWKEKLSEARSEVRKREMFLEEMTK